MAKKTPKTDGQVYTWVVSGIPGDGRGGAFFNTPTPRTDDETGVEILDYDGYDDDDDYDDFGSQYYTAWLKGTYPQVREFVKNEAYGDMTDIIFEVEE